MHQPKIRIIAGPNGSGKTTFIKKVRENNYLNIQNYINADDIQLELKNQGSFSLSIFPFQTNVISFNGFVNHSGFRVKIEENSKLAVLDLLEFKDNCIYLKTKENTSYFYAMIANFIRFNLLENFQSFTYETVISHPSKIEFLKKAKKKGYKIYLYFLCTENTEINKLNVKNRVANGGHFIDDETIEKRFYRTLDNLFDAIKSAEVSYLLQNNMIDFSSVCTIKNEEIINQSPISPQWFTDYYLNKIKQ